MRIGKGQGAEGPFRVEGAQGKKGGEEGISLPQPGDLPKLSGAEKTVELSKNLKILGECGILPKELKKAVDLAEKHIREKGADTPFMTSLVFDQAVRGNKYGGG